MEPPISEASDMLKHALFALTIATGCATLRLFGILHPSSQFRVSSEYLVENVIGTVNRVLPGYNSVYNHCNLARTTWKTVVSCSTILAII